RLKAAITPNRTPCDRRHSLARLLIPAGIMFSPSRSPAHGIRIDHSPPRLTFLNCLQHIKPGINLGVPRKTPECGIELTLGLAMLQTVSQPTMSRTGRTTQT